jgi:hypothetical protein
MLERPDIRVFVGQANFDRKVLLFLKDSMELEPWSPAARTKVQDPARSRIFKRPSEARNDGFVEIHNV